MLVVCGILNLGDVGLLVQGREIIPIYKPKFEFIPYPFSIPLGHDVQKSTRLRRIRR